MKTPPPVKDLMKDIIRRCTPAAAMKTKEAAEPFEDWEDPVWTYNLLTCKKWMARVIATFYCSAGVDDPEDLSAPAEEKNMTLKTLEKNLNRAKQAYIDQLERLNGKKQTRCKPYNHSLKWDAYRRLIWEVLLHTSSSEEKRKR
jgi:hypothetical protein